MNKSNNNWSNSNMHPCMQKKGFINGGGELNKRTMHNCMQQKMEGKSSFSNTLYSFKSILVQIIIGLVGAVGIWLLNPLYDMKETGEVITLSNALPLLICVVLIIVGIFGIYDLIRRLLRI